MDLQTASLILGTLEMLYASAGYIGHLNSEFARIDPQSVPKILQSESRKLFTVDCDGAHMCKVIYCKLCSVLRILLTHPECLPGIYVDSTNELHQ